MTTINVDLESINGIKVAADWVKDLESSDSRKHKEGVFEKALMAAKLGSANAQCFLFNCYQAYNPFFVFGIRQVPETQGLTGRDNPWTKFWALLEALRTRSITGNRARDAVEALSQQFDSEEWNGLARRVLIKDLRCGISEKTINKIVGRTEYRIPVFSCQLAQDSADHPKKLKGTKRLEVKLDGVRVLAVVDGANVTLYSRNGKEFENFPQIADAIEDARHHFQRQRPSGTRFVLDGEIVGDSFQQLMRQAHRKSNAKTTGMVYHIFDIIPLDNFQEGHFNEQLHKRLDWLEPARTALMENACLRVMPGMNVDLDTAEGHDVMQRFAEAAVEQGYEGIMIKNIDAPYECRRSDFWLKYKPFIEVSLEITDVEEGTGRNQGRLGALVCSGIDSGRKISVNVGSGFSDSDRDSFYRDRDHIIGHVVEVRADSITQNQDGSYSLRFPRFLRFRGFEAKEKF